MFQCLFFILQKKTTRTFHLYLFFNFQSLMIQLFFSLSSSKMFIRAILLGFCKANVFTTFSQSIAISLYAQIMHSPVSLWSVWVVLLKDFTLFNTEILLSHSQVVTGNVSNIHMIVWIFGNIILLDPFSAPLRLFEGAQTSKMSNKQMI